MEGATMVRIDRKSSIESEPRTLTLNQIQRAREGAMKVLRTRGIEEAMNIFTEGLEPVVSVVKQNGDTSVMDTNDDQCEYSRGDSGQRDVVSAPF
ncbi:hypothetical protein FNV43_RR18872 [Rhamnella rubrinervis]|uniref:Uncharacterized protein n=1 Tax=Rhamnella rubrinervis TaxID=2594499 RepID=A0A8K0E4K1_9ROSA|nr:hypothetical protein FNV43_RR18872 [Rhamnella rubrinervis]